MSYGAGYLHGASVHRIYVTKLHVKIISEAVLWNGCQSVSDIGSLGKWEIGGMEEM